MARILAATCEEESTRLTTVTQAFTHTRLSSNPERFMVLTILIILAGLLVVLLIIAATRPNHFRIERALRIGAPAEKIFPHIMDFHRWQAWSPWEKLDPAMRRTHSGATSGTGAVYEWEGNKKVGKGRMEIVETVPPRAITIKLDFLAPFEAHNVSEFVLEGNSDATTVTWSIHGPNSFMSKVMGLFVNMDKMIGKDFDTGLANLKHVVEGE